MYQQVTNAHNPAAMGDTDRLGGAAPEDGQQVHCTDGWCQEGGDALDVVKELRVAGVPLGEGRSNCYIISEKYID